MPVILDGANASAWLRPDATADELRALMVSRSPEGMRVEAVAGPISKKEEADA